MSWVSVFRLHSRTYKANFSGAQRARGPRAAGCRGHRASVSCDVVVIGHFQMGPAAELQAQAHLHHLTHGGKPRVRHAANKSINQ
ncbi:hypothetical protein ABVT39_022384 [Epinephelus coioides]